MSMSEWPFNSAWAMTLSLPLLFLGLLLFVHLVVDFGPRTIREHRVTYRPIQTRLADLLLIIRLVFRRREQPGFGSDPREGEAPAER